MERNLALILAPFTFWLAITIISARRRTPSPPSPTDPSPDGVERGGSTASTLRDVGRGVGGGGEKPITVEELAGWMRGLGDDRKPSDVVRAAVAEHGVSERTAWRAWDRVKPAPAPGPLARLFGGAR